MGTLCELRKDLLAYGSGPTLEEMPRRTLADKLLNGPTAAHCIEEIHTPINYAYLTCTTGSSALQNIVGVTRQELPGRIHASICALERAGLRPGDHLLITYPPLVSVFPREALDSYGLRVSFILRPSRDALLVALGTEKPAAVIGESRFLRAALVDARQLGVRNELPERLILIAAGSPMDPALLDEASWIPGAGVHDLYGCQEFGWLCLDGMPLRDDITVWNSGRSDNRFHLLVGGLPTGDCFLLKKKTDGSQRVLTETRQRVETEPEITVIASAAADRETVCRAARSILRCKAKVVRVPQALQCKAQETILHVSLPGSPKRLTLKGSKETALFDALLEAQKMYQREARTDPVWYKEC